jgi:hypothetical protein
MTPIQTTKRIRLNTNARHCDKGCWYTYLNTVYTAIGICPVYLLRKNSFFLNQCTGQSTAESDDTQRLHIYNYDVDLLMMSRVMLETCRGF